VSQIIATFFYIGHLRPAPGSWGSLAALLSGAGLICSTGLIGLCAGIFLACLLGYWATAQETADQYDHDPSEIVIDEVAGQWIALLPLAIWPLPFDSAAVYYLFGFFAFRLFDITKPGLVGWADRLVGPLGVMLDDVIAGVMAAAVMALVMVPL
jgi:phosphatidylglycerophosphatase A